MQNYHARSRGTLRQSYPPECPVRGPSGPRSRPSCLHRQRNLPHQPRLGGRHHRHPYRRELAAPRRRLRPPLTTGRRLGRVYHPGCLADGKRVAQPCAASDLLWARDLAITAVTAPTPAWAFQALLRQVCITCSIGRPATCLGNAVAEAFFATLKVEHIHRQP